MAPIVLSESSTTALTFLGERLVFAVPTFAAVSIALVGGWLGVVTLLNRQVRAKAVQAGTQQL